MIGTRAPSIEKLFISGRVVPSTEKLFVSGEGGGGVAPSNKEETIFVLA